mmetsp:Transcript_17510/g.40211  ORF Transcript_17510/g.40211 Transcript_17510/m.40211 type:complete len:1377 (-) Transcript_17510:332-4462(-)
MAARLAPLVGVVAAQSQQMETAAQCFFEPWYVSGELCRGIDMGQYSPVEQTCRKLMCMSCVAMEENPGYCQQGWQSVCQYGVDESNFQACTEACDAACGGTATSCAQVHLPGLGGVCARAGSDGVTCSSGEPVLLSPQFSATCQGGTTATGDCGCQVNCTGQWHEGVCDWRPYIEEPSNATVASSPAYTVRTLAATLTMVMGMVATGRESQGLGLLTLAFLATGATAQAESRCLQDVQYNSTLSAVARSVVLVEDVDNDAFSAQLMQEFILGGQTALAAADTQGVVSFWYTGQFGLRTVGPKAEHPTGQPVNGFATFDTPLEAAILEEQGAICLETCTEQFCTDHCDSLYGTDFEPSSCSANAGTQQCEVTCRRKCFSPAEPVVLPNNETHCCSQYVAPDRANVGVGTFARCQGYNMTENYAPIDCGAQATVDPAKCGLCDDAYRLAECQAINANYESINFTLVATITGGRCDIKCRQVCTGEIYKTSEDAYYCCVAGTYRVTPTSTQTNFECQGDQLDMADLQKECTAITTTTTAAPRRLAVADTSTRTTRVLVAYDDGTLIVWRFLLPDSMQAMQTIDAGHGGDRVTTMLQIPLRGGLVVSAAYDRRVVFRNISDLSQTWVLEGFEWPPLAMAWAAGWGDDLPDGNKTGILVVAGDRDAMSYWKPTGTGAELNWERVANANPVVVAGRAPRWIRGLLYVPFPTGHVGPLVAASSSDGIRFFKEDGSELVNFLPEPVPGGAAGNTAVLGGPVWVPGADVVALLIADPSIPAISQVEFYGLKATAETADAALERFTAVAVPADAGQATSRPLIFIGPPAETLIVGGAAVNVVKVSSSACVEGTEPDIKFQSCSACAAGFSGVATGPAAVLLDAVDEVVPGACFQCIPGQYQPNPGQGSCLECEPGKISTAVGQQTCQSCGETLFQDEAGKTECKQCGDGTNSSADFASCVDCDPGRFGIGGVCTRCQDGTVADAPGKTECVACSGGTAAAAGEFNGITYNRFVCKQCDAGFVRKDGNCEICGNGKFFQTGDLESCSGQCGDGEQTTSDGMGCEPCPHAYAGSGGVCAQCPKGRLPSSDAEPPQSDIPDRCVLCPVGKSGPEKALPERGEVSGECYDCIPGRYAANEGSQLCLLCEPGRHAPDPGMSTCVLCPPGQIMPGSGNSTCEACDPGNEADVTRTECIPCTPGRFYDDGVCQDCAPGTVSKEPKALQCEPCESGQSADSARRSCEQCSAGRFELNGTCMPCAQGTVSTQMGATVCDETCQDGQQNNTDNTECVGCPPGFAGTGGTCSPCPWWQLANESNLTVCSQRCPPGHFPSNDRTLCLTFTAGYPPPPVVEEEESPALAILLGCAGGILVVGLVWRGLEVVASRVQGKD